MSCHSWSLITRKALLQYIYHVPHRRESSFFCPGGFGHIWATRAPEHKKALLSCLRAGPGLYLVLTLFYQRCFIRVQQQLLTTEQTSPCLARMFLRQILLSSNALVVTVTTVQGKLFLNIFCHFLRFLLWKTDPSDHFKTLSNHYQWCLYNIKLGKAKIYNSKNSYSNKIVKFNLKTRSEPRVNNYRQLAKDIK